MNHIANLITAFRILGVGVIFWMTPYTTNYTQILVILFYTFICLTDFLDGWIARRLRIESELGKILDPLADKILVLLFLPLLEMQVITSFPVFIILAREFAIMGLRVYSVQQGGDSIPAQFTGKLKTALTFPVCGILFGRVAVETVDIPIIFQPIQLLINWVMSWPSSIILLLIYTVVALTIWSFVDYFDHFLWGLYLKRFDHDEERARQSLRALIPNFFSLLNILFGCFGLFFALNSQFRFSALFLVMCVIFDAIDGSIARRLNASTTFGARLDTIADFVSFGLLPAMIIFVFLKDQFFVISIVLGLIYLFATAFRLVRFSSTGHSDYFEGVPSPFAASIVMFSKISVLFNSVPVFSAIVIFMSLLMVSKLPYPHRHMAAKRRFLRFVQFPAFIFTLLSMAMLIRGKSGGNFYVYDILVMIFALYILTPVIYWKDFKKDSHGH
ncbi:MAG: CDP-alcohol phosphatidyltransferase family protein [Candidatus Margulisiibacteriota bacterium]